MECPQRRSQIWPQGATVPAFRASQPPGEVLLANRGHLLSRLTFPSENHHRAGHTGRLREATLADMGRCRMGKGGFLRSTQQERSDLFDRFAKG
jgi:hypothetical protein